MSRYVFVALMTALFSCSGSAPSNSDIKKKILMEYTCMETAEIEGLEVHDKKNAETVSDAEGYEYTVSGEVVWNEGCNEFGRVEKGKREKFEKKKVYLVKIDGEWK